eukprot:12199483-Alexandrium_andersonii.AAC.1
MSASLVGSEMCIRDRLKSVQSSLKRLKALLSKCCCPIGPARAYGTIPVSYTHLTLPTICSV